ncbi:EamA family transporter [Rhizobiaceae bacterium BDR2-2]|uniref:EamA family transporter n=1 Tax=Ectorhizobium quercum TaxID=2965071 RepID=A0AAE3MZJ4_9HYPH|nr:EamA family transporter [Ectorhizobium quercum]MCX8997834.1 EamA family transporter [Ectorhizobium quercum]
MRLPHILLALTTVVLWGYNFVVIKIGVAAVPPLFLTSMRYLFSALPLVFFLRKPDVPWKVMIFYGLAMGAGQFGFLFPAIRLGLPAGLASLVLQMQAFFTMGLAAIFIGERIGPVRIAGALVAFCGLGVIAIERMQAATALVPLLMCIAAALCWATANIVNRGTGKVDPIAFIAWTSLVPVLPLLALSAVVEGPQAIWAAATAPSWPAIGSLVYLVVCATLIGTGIWSFLLTRYPAGQVAPFSLLVPVFGLSSAAFFLGERITGIEAAGGALVIAGLVLNVFGTRLVAVLRAK